MSEVDDYHAFPGAGYEGQAVTDDLSTIDGEGVSDERGQDLKWTATVMRGLLELANEFQRTGKRDRELTVRRGIEEIHRLRGRGEDKCEHCGGSDFNSPCERCGAPQCCDPCCRETTATELAWRDASKHCRRKARKLVERWEKGAELTAAAPVGMDKVRYERYDTLIKCAKDLRRWFGVEGKDDG